MRGAHPRAGQPSLTTVTSTVPGRKTASLRRRDGARRQCGGDGKEMPRPATAESARHLITSEHRRPPGPPSAPLTRPLTTSPSREHHHRGSRIRTARCLALSRGDDGIPGGPAVRGTGRGVLSGVNVFPASAPSCRNSILPGQTRQDEHPGTREPQTREEARAGDEQPAQHGAVRGLRAVVRPPVIEVRYCPVHLPGRRTLLRVAPPRHARRDRRVNA